MSIADHDGTVGMWKTTASASRRREQPSGAIILTPAMEVFDSLQAKVDALRAELEKLETVIDKRSNVTELSQSDLPHEP